MTDLTNPTPPSAAVREIRARISKSNWRHERVRLRVAQFLLVFGVLLVAFGLPLSAHLAWLFTQGADAATEAFRALPYSFVGSPFWMPLAGVALVVMSRTEIRRVRGNMAALARLEAMNSA